MTSVQNDYLKLRDISHHISVLSGISHLLDWDQETYMPEGASGIRAEQLKTLAGLIHKEKTGKKFSSALSKLIDIKTGVVLSKGLTESQVAALRQWRRDYVKETCLPASFVEEFAKLSSQSVVVWRNAKKENSFQQFAPYLDKIITMCRRKADLMGYKEHPYDALIDLYEPDITTSEVDHLFQELRKSITALLKKIKTSKQIDDKFLFGKFPQNKQMEFANVLLEAMGFDKTKGRLDFSSHPFSSSSHPHDSRITTRIHPNSLMSNISVILHEGGHSLYEMGLPVQEYGTPLGEALSLGMHESQSRWWETRIGQSKSFWKHFLPILKKQFSGKLDKITLEDFYRAINKVEPSLIRVEADEVTYSLHVILRFEIEKGLIEGSLSVRDIPEIWNSKMEELLGIVPQSNAEGCLQDIHWSMGSFGYFPTYTLGNLYSAHLFKGFEKKFSNWEKSVEKGELRFIQQWLDENVYQHGRRYSSKELLKKAVGQPFSEKAYVQYLNDKYQSIYHF